MHAFFFCLHWRAKEWQIVNETTVLFLLVCECECVFHSSLHIDMSCRRFLHEFTCKNKRDRWNRTFSIRMGGWLASPVDSSALYVFVTCFPYDMENNIEIKRLFLPFCSVFSCNKCICLQKVPFFRPLLPSSTACVDVFFFTSLFSLLLLLLLKSEFKYEWKIWSIKFIKNL